METPKPEVLQLWKEQYGSVRYISMEGYDIYYRGLTVSEQLAIAELEEKLNKYELADVTINLAVLTDKPDFKDAGSPITLHTLIMKSSILLEEDYQNLINASREWASANNNSLNYALAVSVAALYPGLNLLDLLNMTTDKLFRTISMIEIAMQTPILDNLGQGSADGGSPTLHVSPEELQQRGVRMDQVKGTHDALRQQILNHGQENVDQDFSAPDGLGP